ncbi:hypothetical protein MKD33_03680, partial [Chromobacterium piscinae]
AGKPACLVSC